MRFSTFSAIATLAVTALAQDLSQLPTCGTGCVGNGLASTGCGQIDVACICRSANWIGELSCCVSQACQPDDQASIIRFAQQICGPFGVTNLPTVAACTGTFTPSLSQSATATPSSSAGSLESAASSASGAISSGLASVSAAASSAASAATGSSSNVAAAPTAFALPMGVAAAAGLFAAAL